MYKMKKIKIGHIGIAHDHSGATMETVLKYPDVFEVVGVVEPNEEYRRKFGNDPAYKELNRLTLDELFAIEDLDAVLVEGYELDLVPIAQKCIDRGVHVHMDKPGGEDIVAFEKLLNDAKEKNLTVQLGYMFRYNTAIKYCKEAIENGTLGEIFEIDLAMNTEHPKEKREWLGNFQGGIMFYLGCHLVDLMLWLNGVPEKIIPYNEKTYFDGVDSIDNGFALFKYKNGISTIRATSTEVNGYGRRQLVVCGSKGTIEIKPLENPTKMTISLSNFTKGKEYIDCKKIIEPKTMAGRYDEMMLDFAKFVRGEKTNPFTYEYELQLQKMILKACEKD